MRTMLKAKGYNKSLVGAFDSFEQVRTSSVKNLGQSKVVSQNQGIICLGDGKFDKTYDFKKEFPFMKMKYTQLYTVAQIVEQEQGKQGLEELKLRQSQIQVDQQQFENKKQATNNQEQPEQKVTVKNTLKIEKSSKDAKHTTEIKKKKMPQMQNSQKKMAVKKVIESLSQKPAAPMKKRDIKKAAKKSLKDKSKLPTQEGDEQVQISKKDFDMFLKVMKMMKNKDGSAKGKKKTKN